jgi:hypothetical protein
MQTPLQLPLLIARVRVSSLASDMADAQALWVSECANVLNQLDEHKKATVTELVRDQMDHMLAWVDLPSVKVGDVPTQVVTSLKTPMVNVKCVLQVRRTLDINEFLRTPASWP